MSLLNKIASSSGQLAPGTTDVKATAGVVWSMILTPAAADSTISIQNGTVGTVLWNGIAKANTNSVVHTFPNGLNCPAGIRVAVGGVAATAEITYV